MTINSGSRSQRSSTTPISVAEAWSLAISDVASDPFPTMTALADDSPAREMGFAKRPRAGADRGRGGDASARHERHAQRQRGDEGNPAVHGRPRTQPRPSSCSYRPRNQSSCSGSEGYGYDVATPQRQPGSPLDPAAVLRLRGGRACAARRTAPGWPRGAVPRLRLSDRDPRGPARDSAGAASSARPRLRDRGAHRGARPGANRGVRLSRPAIGDPSHCVRVRRRRRS